MFDCLCCNHDDSTTQLQPEVTTRQNHQPTEKVSLKRMTHSSVEPFNVNIPRQLQYESVGGVQSTTNQRQVQSFPYSGASVSEERQVALALATKEQELRNLKLQEQQLTKRIEQLDRTYQREVAPLEQKCQQLQAANLQRSQQLAVLNERVQLIQRLHPQPL